MVDAFCRFADALNERLGRVGAWMFLPLTFIIVYEVTMRYVFNNPSIWSWDVAFHFQTFLIITGGGYLIIYHGHVRVDVFFAKFSPRGQRIVDLVLFPLFVLAYGALLWLAIKEVGHALETQEHMTSTLEPRLWPVKTMAAIGVSLLLFQGIAQSLRNLRGVITGKYYEVVGGGAFAAAPQEEKKS